MSLFYVTVDCYWNPPSKKAPTNKVRRKFIVEADDRNAAKLAGVAHADETAHCAKDWIKFEWVEVSHPIKLPMEIPK